MNIPVTTGSMYVSSVKLNEFDYLLRFSAIAGDPPLNPTLGWAPAEVVQIRWISADQHVNVAEYVGNCSVGLYAENAIDHAYIFQLRQNFDYGVDAPETWRSYMLTQTYDSLLINPNTRISVYIYNTDATGTITIHLSRVPGVAAITPTGKYPEPLPVERPKCAFFDWIMGRCTR